MPVNCRLNNRITYIIVGVGWGWGGVVVVRWDGVGVGVGVGVGLSSGGSGGGRHSRKWVKHATLDDYRPLTVDMGSRAPPPPSLKSLICPWGGVVMEWLVGASFMNASWI
jgi:hypothetical protein